MSKVVIVTDLEGVTGVSTIDAMQVGSDLYKEACVNLMKDVNTAISALYDAGADLVYVNDGHFYGQNFVKEMLDPRAKQITVYDHGSIIKEVDCAVLIGMHAMAGTMNGFLDHTQNSARIHRYFYDGEMIGEMMQYAVFAGYFGVPCVAMSGDETACKEANKFFPDMCVAPVKKALSRNLAECYNEKVARENIYNAVKEGYLKRKSVKPYPSKLPLNVEIEFNRGDYADEAIKNNPSLQRIDVFKVRSVKEKVEDYLDVLITNYIG